MKVFLITAVWGAWHTDAFANVTLPSLLADQNLPAIADMHSCEYRIFTTAASAKILGKLPALARLRDLMPVELIHLSSDDSISSDMHVKAWQTAADTAAEAKAAVVALHPDTPWTNGSLKFLGTALSNGRGAIVVPNIRVISETFIPALERYKNSANGSIRLPSQDATDLAVKHLHPLSAAMVPGVGYSASATEIYWAVPKHGLLLRQISRPAIAAVPHICPLNFEFYMHHVTDPELVLNVTNADDMLMLSMAPLFKDFSLLNLGRAATPQLLGQWAAHPQNNTPLNEWFSAQSLRLPISSRIRDDSAWKKTQPESDGFMDRAISASDTITLAETLRRLGCFTIARLIAAGLQITDFDRRIRSLHSNGSVVMFAPTDAAIEQYGRWLLKNLLSPRNENKLLRFLMNHFQNFGSIISIEKDITEAGVTIKDRASSHNFTIIIIDRISEKSSRTLSFFLAKFMTQTRRSIPQPVKSIIRKLLKLLRNQNR